MKKMTFLKLRGWCVLFVLALLPLISNGQCINSGSFGTITSDNAGQIQQISGCTWSTEYNTINGLLVGENYIFTATNQGVDKYVSITDASNVSIAHGPSPLIVNAITATTVRLHVSNSAACDGGSVCHVTTVQFLADCPAPVGLGVANLLTTSATANWTGVGPGTAWDLEYGPTGFTQGSGTLVTNLAAATYNFINLTAATTYQFYVRSKCATEDSLWSAPFSFTTNCVTVTAYSENFDAYPSGYNVDLPNCWAKGGSPFTVDIYDTSVAPASAPNHLNMYGNNGDTVGFASMPLVSNLAAGTHRLRFRAYEAYQPGRVLDVGYLTNATDVSSYVFIAEVNLGAGPTNSQEFVITPGILPTTAVRLVFRNGGVIAGSTNAYIDDVNWEAIPTCLEPSALFASEITVSSATLAWAAPSTAPALGYEYYLSTSSTNPIAATPATGSIAAGITELDITSLLPDTQYYVWVRSVCTISDIGIWVGSASFKTLCVAVTEYSENFDAYTAGFNSALPICWTKGGSVSDVSIAAWSVAPASAPNRLYMFGYNGETVTFANMPIVSNLAAGTHRLRFRAHEAWNPDRVLEVGYLTNATDVSSYVFIAEVNLGTGDANSQEFVITPGILPATAVRLAFRNGGVNDGSTNAYIDDVSWEAIPTCIEPTDLFVSEITSSSAAVAWTPPTTAPALGYEYYLSTSNANPTAATPATGSVAGGIIQLDLTSLVPATQYYVWVRSVCTISDIGVWVGSVSFKTLCVAITEYSENFDSYVVGWNGPIPECWNKGGLGSVYVTNWTSFPMSAENRMVMTADASSATIAESIAAMPVVTNLQANTHRLRFMAYNDFGADRFLEIGYLTNAEDYSTYQYISQVDLQTGPTSAQQYIIVPGVLPANAVRLVFKNTSIPGDYTQINIDDVKWEPIPTCLEPLAVITSGVLATTASISWTAPSTAPANGYEYYLSTTTTEPTSSTAPSGSVAAGITTVALTSLTPTTQYYVWVRSVCSGTDTSFWTTSITFTTPCAAFTPAYTETFETWAPWPINTPTCWERYAAGTQLTGPSGPLNSGSWNNGGYLNNGFSGAAKITIWDTAANANGWLVSPVFDLTAGGYQVKYKVGATEVNSTAPITEGAMGTDDFVYVLMSTDGGVTWTNLTTYSATNTPSHLGTTAVFNIPTVTSSIVKFAFYGTSGTEIDPQVLDFFIDDFVIQAIPLVAPVCSATVTAVPNAACGNEATAISWSAAEGSDGYKLTIGTTAGGSEILNGLVVGNLTYSYVGSLNTTYYYKVVPFNSNGDATGCTEQTFTTAVNGCVCTPVYTNGVIYGDFISNLVITETTLSHNSGTSTTAPYFNHYTGQPNFTATLTEGTTYTVNATVGFGNSAISVWIDLNDNLTFEESERVGSSTANITDTGSFTITIPCNAPGGLHRMRVRMVFGASGSSLNPCSSYAYGEVEDYDVTIAPIAPPTGDAVQAITAATAADATIEDLVVVGTEIKWFATEADALANTNQLPVGSLITDGATYYAVSSSGTCNSDALAVTANVTLSVGGFDNASFKYYPNPVTDVLSVSYSNTISEVVVYNLLGQQMLTAKPNATQTQMDLSGLTAGTYMVKVTSDEVTKTVKVVKN